MTSHISDELRSVSTSSSTLPSSTSAFTDDSSSSALADGFSADKGPPTVYPYDLLNLSSGGPPPDKDTAALYWRYRDDGPAYGVHDAEEPDGEKMLAKINLVRHGLKGHIEQTFWRDAKQMAQDFDLQVPSRKAAPVTRKDFGSALKALERVEGSDVNEKKVYMVVHHFHDKRQWLSEAVDAWCHENNIEIVFPDLEIKRKCPTNRGGFGAWARVVKNDVVKQLMANMLKNAGWCIHKRNNHQGAGKKYEKLFLTPHRFEKKVKCYVATEDASITKASRSDGSKATGSRTDPIIVPGDADAFATHMAKELIGQDLSKESILKIVQTYNPQSNFVGREIDSGNSGSTPGADSELTSSCVHGSAAAPAHQQQHDAALQLIQLLRSPTKNTSVHETPTAADGGMQTNPVQQEPPSVHETLAEGGMQTNPVQQEPPNASTTPATIVLETAVATDDGTHTSVAQPESPSANTTPSVDDENASGPARAAAKVDTIVPV